MNQIEAALNTNGNQTIARLQCSIVDPEAGNGRQSSPGELATKDLRLPAPDQNIANTTDLLEEDAMGSPNARRSNFDIDLFPGDKESYGKNTKTPHVFGRAEAFRGEHGSDWQEEEDAGFARKRRRIAGLPLIEKLVPFL